MLKHIFLKPRMFAFKKKKNKFKIYLDFGCMQHIKTFLYFDQKHYLSQQLNANITVEASKISQE